MITRVLPEPAPAKTKQGPCKKLTASCCARFRPADIKREMRERNLAKPSMIPVSEQGKIHRC